MSLPDASTETRISLLCWHLDRYDRLRASTASRAGVVLSASAILFAGHTFVLSRVLGMAGTQVNQAVWGLLLTASLGASLLVVVALLQATSVLTTPRGSRDMFLGDEPMPPGLVFNDSDTVKHVRSFAEFKSVAEAPSSADIAEAALTELWICIRQHRYRYLKLRSAVNYLRYAAIAFVCVLLTTLMVDVL